MSYNCKFSLLYNNFQVKRNFFKPPIISKAPCLLNLNWGQFKFNLPLFFSVLNHKYVYKLKRKNYQNISNDSLLHFSGFSLGSVHSFRFSKDKEAVVTQYPSTSFTFIWNMMARCAKCGCLFVFLAVVCCFTTT